jgi:Ca2+-binding RTX toxin-like protein
MRRAVLLAVFGSVLLVAFAGVALAEDIFCNGGRCEGTELSDFITGTPQSDQIFALGGGDIVFALAGQDELNGQNGSDVLAGENNKDTYNGGGGSDLLSEFEGLVGPVTNSGPDVMNGGTSDDFMEGNTGADILRGQDGDECEGFINNAWMYGDQGGDQLYGNAGEDCMEGDQGTDEHYGGNDNDFIDALNGDVDPETDAPLGTHDLVDCGSGEDTALVNSDEDIVRANCEHVVDVATSAASQVQPSATPDEDQQQAKEAFIQEHGLQVQGP